jgi:hypothetical protein
MIRTIHRVASMREMQVFGDSYNAIVSVPGVEEYDSRLTHAPPGTSPAGEASNSASSERNTYQPYADLQPE